MLSQEQLDEIPKTTQKNWDKFSNEEYHLTEWCSSYVKQFEEIKNVYQKKNLFRSVRMLSQVSKGYDGVMNDLKNGKKLLRENALELTNAIAKLSKYTKQPIKRIVKLFGVNKDWYYRHRPHKNCNKSPLGKCYRTYPYQMTIKEVALMDDSLKDERNRTKPKTTIYWQMVRKGIVYCSISTFFKYAKLLGYVKPKKGKKPRTIGFRATRKFEWLHIDVMHVKTLDDGVQKVAFVKDNYSKSILHHATTDGKAGSAFIKQLMEETYAKHKMYNLMEDINILTDGGPENKGLFLDWIENLQAPPQVMKITAKSDVFPFPNNMSESTHRIYKSEFMQNKTTLNKATHEEDVKRFIIYYNTDRNPTEHWGYTCQEVLDGAVPDKHKYKQLIKEARAKRIKENKAFKQCYF